MGSDEATVVRVPPYCGASALVVVAVGFEVVGLVVLVPGAVVVVAGLLLHDARSMTNEVMHNKTRVRAFILGCSSSLFIMYVGNSVSGIFPGAWTLLFTCFFIQDEGPGIYLGR